MFLICILSGCNDAERSGNRAGQTGGIASGHSSGRTRYALNFSYSDHVTGGIEWRKVSVKAGGREYLYCLYRNEKPDLNGKTPDGQAGSALYPGAVRYVRIPAAKIVSLSSENTVFLDGLDRLDLLAAVDLEKNISSGNVHQLVESGRVLQTGEGRDIDLEILYKVKPDIIFSPWTGGSYDPGGMLAEKGFPVAVTSGWLEDHPLGRAEWILFVSLFLDMEDKGLELFSVTEERYNMLKEAVASGNTAENSTNTTTGTDWKTVRPSVLFNMVYGDSWIIPGGGSYPAALVKDAGGFYPWQDSGSSGSVFLDFEAVLEMGADADVWLVNTPGIRNRSDIAVRDRRYALFSAFRSGQVFNNDLVSGGRGNPYWDEGVAYPYRILSDLARILHPGLPIPSFPDSPEGGFYYYRPVD